MDALEAIRLQPVPRTVPCKCCGATAVYFGAADFNKNCEESAGTVLPRREIPVHYHRCATCGFLFTTALDHFTEADFKQHVYNDEYPMIDPDFARARPVNNAKAISGLLATDKSIRLLDYGGGEGLTTRLLKEDGFVNVVCYDPFFSSASGPPQGQFDCIVCFEVLEHSTNPRFIFSQILSMLKDPGIVFFSTVFQPPEIAQMGVSWSYIAPRNGHVSIYTTQAVQAIVGPLGFRLGSFNPASHLLVKSVPPFVKHLRLPALTMVKSASDDRA